MDPKTLIKFGLSSREATAYFHLLETENALASEISKKSKESRTNTYDTLNSLVKKGLVSYVIKNNRRYFIATSPKKLLDWIDQKKEELEREKKQAEELIPDLMALKTPTEKKVSVEVYEGVEGMRSVFKDMIEMSASSKKEILVFGAIAGILRDMDPIYHERHYEERKKRKIKARYIFMEGSTHPIAPYTEYRYLPSHYEKFTATGIYGNKVSFWLLTSPATIIVVENEEFAKTYRSNFKVLWGIAKEKKE